jgi:parallel beta-helix repeat protein
MAAYLKFWDISNINAPPDANGFRYPIKKVYEVKEASATGNFANSYFSDLVSGEASNSIHNVHIRNENSNDVAYISYYTKGLRILDVANPLSPTELGYYDTPAVAGYFYPVYNGSWGVYPYFNSGTILVSDMRGLYVFRRASECGGTIATNTTWSGALFVTSNVTVNSGATLTISPGTTLAFANGTGMTVNGNLIAVSDDPNKRISFTSNSAPLTAGAWNGITITANSSATTLRRCDVQYAVNGITINYNGYNNNVTAEKCRIRYNSGDGLLINGNNWSGVTVHPLIKDNTISNNYTGLELVDYAMPTITGNRIENNSTYGLLADTNCNAVVQYNYVANNGTTGLFFFLSCYAEVHRNTVKNNGSRGINSSSNSNLIACGANADTAKGRNEISYNSGVGVYASTSSPNFGQDQSSFYGNNWIHDNTGFEAQQSGAGYQLHARRGYWSGQESNTSGTVNKTPVLGSAPSPVGWGRSTNYYPHTRIWFNTEAIAFLPFSEAQYAMQTKSGLSQVAKAAAGATDWTADLQAAIAQGLATGDWSKAGEVVGALHRELQNARVPDVDFMLVNNYAHDAAVAAFIRKMLALVLMEKELAANDISTALTKLTALAMSAPENAAEFLVNVGAIYLYRQNDVAAAENVLAQLQTLARNGDAVAAENASGFEFILQRYQQRQKLNASGSITKLMATASPALAVPEIVALAQNYPNPFNPTTAIRFRLNERQKIRLVIFDLNGKMVRTLLDDELAAGEQTLSWDGRDEQGRFVVSGVYFYELVTGNKIERRKMTLVR